MLYARIENGAVAAFPYTVDKFRAENPLVSLPLEPRAEQLAEVGICEVTVQPLPQLGPFERVAGYQVEQVEGAWTQVWTVEEVSLAEKKGAVIAERERRLALGFTYDFGDERGIHLIGTAPDDMNGWDEVTSASQAAVAVGIPLHPIEITTETAKVVITAMEWQLILLAAAAARQPLWKASFDLQEMDPIPADFANDSYWS